MTIRETVLNARWLNTTIYNTEDIQTLFCNMFEFLEERGKVINTAVDFTRNVPDEFNIITTGSAERVVVDCERDWSEDRTPKVTIGFASRSKLYVTDLEKMGALSEHATMPTDVVAKLVRFYLLTAVWPDKYSLYGGLNREYLNEERSYSLMEGLTELLPFVQQAVIHIGDRPAGAVGLEQVIRTKDALSSHQGRLNQAEWEVKQLREKLETAETILEKRQAKMALLTTKLEDLFTKYPKLRAEHGKV